VDTNPTFELACILTHPHICSLLIRVSISNTATPNFLPLGSTVTHIAHAPRSSGQGNTLADARPEVDAVTDAALQLKLLSCSSTISERRMDTDARYECYGKGMLRHWNRISSFTLEKPFTLRCIRVLVQSGTTLLAFGDGDADAPTIMIIRLGGGAVKQYFEMQGIAPGANAILPGGRGLTLLLRF
jgi:hypothetical protein